MIRIVALLLFHTLILYSSSFAQSNIYHPFPDSVGYFWSVKYEHHDEVCNCVLDLSYIDVLGDTITKDGKIYRLIDYSYYSLIRQDIQDKKVYARHYGPNFLIDTLEYILYDFGLAVGDSINLRLNNGGTFQSEPEYRFLKCTEIDSVLTTVGYRRRLKMEFSQPPYWSQFTELNFDYWVEGIGSMFNLFHRVPECFDFECQLELKCFGKFIQSVDSIVSSESIYGALCSSIVTEVVIPEQNNNFIILQDGNTIGIKLPDELDYNQIFSSELIDLYGRVILQIDYNGLTNLNNIATGIYIVLIRTSKGFLSKKVVICNY
jgi:hypothetical protein